MYPLRLACLMAAVVCVPAHAESLDVIELPAEAPEPQQISLNWDCDVLLLTTSQRFRPSSCQSDANVETHPATELQVEKLTLESAERPSLRRKPRY